MQEYPKYIARWLWLVIYFSRSNFKKNICLYPEIVPRNRLKFKRKLFKNYFEWITTQLLKFRTFRIMWKIKQISEAVIRLSPR